MTTRRAILIQGPGEAKLVEDVPMPSLYNHFIIVKPEYVALNPTDVLHIDQLPSPGAIVGCDYSGVVEQVGEAVTNGLRKGDRVAGCVHGSNAVNHQDGAFANYITAKGDLQMKIPDNVSFIDAATLGVGIVTVGQSLYQSLGLPLPTEPTKESFPILIYGGSTATGTLAIQFAKLSGLEVVTTCSPDNFALVKSLGATNVFDYRSPTCAEDIKKATSSHLAYALDCIGNESSAAICTAAYGPQGGKYTSLNGVEKLDRDDIANQFTLGYTAFGQYFKFGSEVFLPNPRNFDFAVKFVALARDLLEQGQFRVHQPDVREGGLEAILSGLQEMREKKVHGKKLVYRVC